MRIPITAITFVFFVLCLGCGPKAPAGFPKLYNCKIVVTKEGKPLSDATVMLLPESPTGAHATGGKTNSSGIAALRTTQGNYGKPGVPVGQYKIVLNKPVDIEGKLSDEEVNKMPTHERLQYSAEMARKASAMTPVIPFELTDAKRTPLTVEVTSAGGEATINIDEYSK